MGRTPLGSGRVFQYSSDRETPAGHAPSVLVAGRRSATTGSSQRPHRGSEPSCIRERRIALRTSLQRPLRQAPERCLKARAGNPRLRFSAPLNLDRSCRPCGITGVGSPRSVGSPTGRAGPARRLFSGLVRRGLRWARTRSLVVDYTVANGCRPPRRPARQRSGLQPCGNIGTKATGSLRSCDSVPSASLTQR